MIMARAIDELVRLAILSMVWYPVITPFFTPGDLVGQYSSASDSHISGIDEEVYETRSQLSQTQKFDGICLVDSYHQMVTPGGLKSYMAFILQHVFLQTGYLLAAVCLSGALASDYPEMVRSIPLFMVENFFVIVVYCGNDFYRTVFSRRLCRAVHSHLYSCVGCLRKQTRGPILIVCDTSSHIWEYNRHWNPGNQSYAHFFDQFIQNLNISLLQSLKEDSMVVFASRLDFHGIITGDCIGHPSCLSLQQLGKQWVAWVSRISTESRAKLWVAVVMIVGFANSLHVSMRGQALLCFHYALLKFSGLYLFFTHALTSRANKHHHACICSHFATRSRFGLFNCLSPGSYDLQCQWFPQIKKYILIKYEPVVRRVDSIVKFGCCYVEMLSSLLLYQKYVFTDHDHGSTHTSTRIKCVPQLVVLFPLSLKWKSLMVRWYCSFKVRMLLDHVGSVCAVLWKSGFTSFIDIFADCKNSNWYNL